MYLKGDAVKSHEDFYIIIITRAGKLVTGKGLIDGSKYKHIIKEKPVFGLQESCE